MYCQQEDCEVINLIINIITPKKGGVPGFNAYHVIETLKFLKNKDAGRPFLSKYLNLGEASVKTMLKRLKENNLIIQIGKHNKLTKNGEMVLKFFESKLNIFESKLNIEGLEDCLILVLEMNPPKDLTSIYKIRDQIISSSCKIAVVGFIDNKNLGFPGLPDYLQNELINCSKKYSYIVNRGVNIITPRYCMQSLYSFYINIMSQCCLFK
ncbi:hypothetical protein Calag_1279 [Caldisphaera lagunensis DSM 15908]|uniref:PH0730-like N-terminal domain-containing protein n=2 Tax=Caldisphaera lagunensis TaxID=200415 RepID=L0AAP7_CALLD|nr:hypothetical protein Calag_1279 [Caldisphaera lagunensis DSM 15908]